MHSRHLQKKKSRKRSPTRTKKSEIATIKDRGAVSIGVTSPIISREPTNPWALHIPTPLPHGAPHGRPRGHVWPLATCLRYLRLAWAMRGPATWPQCHVVSALDPHATSAPRATSTSMPRQLRGVCGIKTPFLRKIKLKKSEKGHKLQKFITLMIQLLFNPKFLHWISISFLFNIMPLKNIIKKKNIGWIKNNLKAFIKISLF